MSDEIADPTEWWKYVELIMRLEDLNPRKVALRMSISESTIGQWRIQGRRPNPEVARRFAKTFGRPVPEAFVRAGIMEPEDLDHVAAPPLPSAAHLSNDALMAEVNARLIPDRTTEPTGADAAHEPADKFDGRAKTAQELTTTPSKRRAPR